jgi:hypothetical protein
VNPFDVKRHINDGPISGDRAIRLRLSRSQPWNWLMERFAYRSPVCRDFVENPPRLNREAAYFERPQGVTGRGC